MPLIPFPFGILRSASRSTSVSAPLSLSSVPFLDLTSAGQKLIHASESPSENTQLLSPCGQVLRQNSSSPVPMPLHEFLGGKQNIMMEEADMVGRSWLTMGESAGPKLESRPLREESSQETGTGRLSEFNHRSLVPLEGDLSSHTGISTPPSIEHLTDWLDSRGVRDALGTYPFDNKSTSSGQKALCLQPTILDGSPSPIELLPPPMLVAHPVAKRSYQIRNTNTDQAYLHPRKLVASEAVVGLGVSLPSSYALKMPSVSSPLGPGILPSTPPPEVYSPVFDPGAVMRSSPCDFGDSVARLRPSPVVETLSKSQQLSVKDYECINPGPAIARTAWTAGDALAKARSGVSGSPSPRHKTSSYAKPSSWDIKSLPGQAARKEARSRSIRTLENTPPTPKSPQTWEKITVSPLSVATNNLGAIHGFSQSSLQPSPLTSACAKGPFPGLFSEDDIPAWTSSPFQLATHPDKAVILPHFVSQAGAARAHGSASQVDKSVTAKMRVGNAPSRAQVNPYFAVVVGDA